MLSDCPNPQPDCKYAPNCFADTDHIVPRYLANQAGATAMLGIYINHPVNKQQMCRREHDEKTHTEDRFAVAPSDYEMAVRVSEHPALLSRTHKKIIQRIIRRGDGTGTN